MIQVIAGVPLACIASVLVSVAASAQPIVYVDADASPGGTGESWAEAYRELYDALDAASLDPSIEQIWVAEGTYTPNRGLGNREDAFTLVSGVSLYGGFAGSELFLEDRVLGHHPTVLSGDFAGNDGVEFPTGATTGEIPDLPEFQNYEENAHHVVRGMDLLEPVKFDGFTVRGGNADFDGSLQTGGGGMFVERSLLTLTNCSFEFNRCGLPEPDIGGFGGAVFLEVGDYEVSSCRFLTNRGMNGGALGLYSPGAVQPVTCTISDCEFTGNFAEQQSGGAIWSAGARELIVADCSFTGNFSQYGGAIVDHEPRQPASKMFLDCRFVDNRSLVQAGAVWHLALTVMPDTERALFQDCYFENNSTSGGVGGGLLFWSLDAVVIRSRFTRNSAVGGGAVSAVPSPIHPRAGDLDLFGCIFDENVAEFGGAVQTNRCDGLRIAASTFTGNSASSSGAAIQFLQGAVAAEVSNSVLWNNEVNGDLSEESQIVGQPREMTFCLVQGLVDPGQGNIDGDPLFLDPDAGDFRLGTGSPAIDAGDNFRIPADVGDLDGDGDRLEPLPEDYTGGDRFLDDPGTVDTGLGTPPIVDIGAFEFSSDVTSVAAADPATYAPGIRSLRNPARGEVDVSLRIPREGLVTVDVFEAGGRQVLRLHDGVLRSGSTLLRWDARDAHGIPVVAGVYLIRATTPDANAVLKVTLLR